MQTRLIHRQPTMLSFAITQPLHRTGSPQPQRLTTIVTISLRLNQGRLILYLISSLPPSPSLCSPFTWSFPPTLRCSILQGSSHQPEAPYIICLTLILLPYLPLSHFSRTLPRSLPPTLFHITSRNGAATPLSCTVLEAGAMWR